MASACCPDDVLQASEGKTRFVRLARLLVCGGTTVMRELFDYLIPPANLAAVLSSPAVKTRLTEMRNKKILTSPQWDKLYPSSGSVQSASFDITLLFKLSRENIISGLSAPSKGWDKLPNISDTSLPADMARIKYFRNGIAHGDEKMELSEQEFNDYWKEIKDALVRIVGHYATSGSSTVKDWETAIDRLRTDPLTKDDRKNVEELKSWYLDERQLKEMIGSLDSRLENLERQEKRNKSKEFIVRCVVRIAGVGAWLGGTVCVLNSLKDNPEILIDYVKYSIIPTGLAFVGFAFGSIKITMRVETVEALDKIMKRFDEGRLKEDFENILITRELKNLANGKLVELGVEINVEKVINIRNRLLVEKKEAMPPRTATFQRGRSLLSCIIKMIRQWLQTRQLSINQIKEISDDLDRIQKNVNIAKLTGASTGIGGAALLGAGVLASILTMGAATPFLIGAGVAGAVGGGLVSGGAEAVRVVNDKIDQNTVEKLLRADHVKQEEIHNKMRTLQDLVNRISPEENITEEEAWIALLVNFVNENVTDLLLGRRIMKGDFKFLQSPIPSFIQVVGALGISRVMAEWVSLAARNVVRGGIAVFTPILVAIDLYNLVTIAKDVRRGSRSELAQKLREIANELVAEFEAYQDFVDNLRTEQS